jgi:hypothetical protein
VTLAPETREGPVSDCPDTSSPLAGKIAALSVQRVNTWDVIRFNRKNCGWTDSDDNNDDDDDDEEEHSSARGAPRNRRLLLLGRAQFLELDQGVVLLVGDYRSG